MNTVFTQTTERYGYDFVGGTFLQNGVNEYHMRDRQLEELCGAERLQGRRRLQGFRRLTEDEIAALEAGRNRCANWNDVLVSDPFDAALLHDNDFAGLVRLGPLSKGLLRYHDYTAQTGISFSRIISCDIGAHCAVHDCRYLAHYVVGDAVILSSINEMDTTNHAKFGEGVVKQGEDEDVRVWIEPLNETGGRAVLPFAGMTTADAYLWAMYREDAELMAAFKRVTQEGSGTRNAQRGYYGVVGHGAVIKHCLTIKDVRIGEAAYIKGANKLKNLTGISSADHATQIGEGVEMVNGIIGYGCRVFYGCKAVRFVLGNNCNLKYGARLIHSILGDNSTVSCCEILNNLVFPFHEQHHNNSFLIATMIMGQSNMAAGATVGSNHNSRGNDGEIIAGRGFWPGLSSTLKHNCRFASFVLITKGSYPAELNIPLPFSLLTTNAALSRREVMPAYWWLHNMYALERNSWKFRVRDKRVHKAQHIETDYLAPDTAAEIIRALALLEEWAGRDLTDDADDESIYAPARTLERSVNPVRIIKPAKASRAYRDMLLYYGVKAIVEYCAAAGTDFAAFQARHKENVCMEWVNLGGQLVREDKAAALMDNIRAGRLASWEAIHAEYDRLWAEYPEDKAENALEVLRYLDKTPVISGGRWRAMIEKTIELRHYIEEQVYLTKRKDYTDPFRAITFRNTAERDAVLGRLEDNPFVKSARSDTAAFMKLVHICPQCQIADKLP